jgi:hypothetical protein
VLPAARPSYFDAHHSVYGAVKTKRLDAVQRSVDDVTRHMDEILASASSIEESIQQIRPLGFALATPIGSASISAVRTFARLPEVDLFAYNHDDKRDYLTQGMRCALDDIADPWERLAFLESRLLSVTQHGIERSFRNIPPLLKPIYNGYAKYVGAVNALALRSGAGQFKETSPVQVQQDAAREGAMKINRFAELVGRLHVQFGEPGGSSGRRQMLEDSRFLRESAQQHPEANLACHKVLVGCESKCFSSSDEELFESAHAPLLNHALDAHDQSPRRAIIDGFRRSHHRAAFFRSDLWTVGQDPSGRFEPRPAVNLAEAIEPEYGIPIRDLDIDRSQVAGCPAVQLRTLSQQIEFHLDAHDDPAIWGHMASAYKAVNRNAQHRALDQTPRYPLPHRAGSRLSDNAALE